MTALVASGFYVSLRRCPCPIGVGHLAQCNMTASNRMAMTGIASAGPSFTGTFSIYSRLGDANVRQAKRV